VGVEYDVRGTSLIVHDSGSVELAANVSSGRSVFRIRAVILCGAIIAISVIVALRVAPRLREHARHARLERLNREAETEAMAGHLEARSLLAYWDSRRAGKDQKRAEMHAWVEREDLENFERMAAYRRELVSYHRTLKQSNGRAAVLFWECLSPATPRPQKITLSQTVPVSHHWATMVDGLAHSRGADE
jgi:hypothetical protein